MKKMQPETKEAAFRRELIEKIVGWKFGPPDSFAASQQRREDLRKRLRIQPTPVLMSMNESAELPDCKRRTKGKTT